jgi:hypothetical protein
VDPVITIDLIPADDSKLWLDSLKRCGEYDTYDLPSYHILSSDWEKGEPHLFSYREHDRQSALPFIVRRISDLKGFEYFPYSDASSVYGYPGILTNVRQDEPKSASFRSGFQAALLNQLRSINCVSLFVRSNPLLDNNWLFDGLGERVSLGQTVAINLKQSEAQQLKHMTKGHRYDIRKARAKGITVKKDTKFKHLDDFIDMYNDTMSRARAGAYYSFPKQYYLNCKRLLGNSLHLFVAEKEGENVSAALFLTCKKIVQYHLSGTPDRFIELSGAKVIIDTVRRWAVQNGYTWLHLGGGVGSKEDSLFRFKAGFTKKRLSFEIVKITSMPVEYEYLCEHRRQLVNHIVENSQISTFFPFYRIPV